jgi:hypothetical protein
MTALLGSPDFQNPVAQSLRFLTSIAVNTATNQLTDITALVGPNDQAIVFIWSASGAYLGAPVWVLLSATGFTVNANTTANLIDGADVTIPFAGGIITNTSGATVGVRVGKPVLQGGTATGTLLVFAQSAPPTVTTTTRRSLVGQGLVTGAVVVAAGATTTVLVGPAEGQYYRLKGLAWAGGAATVVGVIMSWQRADTHALIEQYSITATTDRSHEFFTDLECDFGFELHNGAAIAVNAVVLYEIWNS